MHSAHTISVYVLRMVFTLSTDYFSKQNSLTNRHNGSKSVLCEVRPECMCCRLNFVSLPVRNLFVCTMTVNNSEHRLRYIKRV